MTRIKGRCIKSLSKVHGPVWPSKTVTKPIVNPKKVRKPIPPPTKPTTSSTTPTKAHTTTITHRKDGTSATQHALSTPDILAQIFEAIANGWGQRLTVIETGARVYQLWGFGKKFLTCCAGVNKTWFIEATRLLWQYPDFRHGNNLSLLLRNVSSAHLDLYASSVQLGFIAPLAFNRLPDENNALNGVEFSRIRLLRLHLWAHTADGMRLFLPLMRCPELEVLEIDPYSLAYKPYINRRDGFEIARRCRVEFHLLCSIMSFVHDSHLLGSYRHDLLMLGSVLESISKSPQDRLRSVRLYQQNDQELFRYASPRSSGHLERIQRCELAQRLA